MEDILNLLGVTEPPVQYRPHPFWSWNHELDEEELRRQIRLMNDGGMGGFFMHARSGLTTPYMGEKWFSCIRACIDEAKKLGLEAWSYDENGWPSGSADGKVPGLGRDYQVRNLGFEALDESFSAPDDDADPAGERGRTLGYYEYGPSFCRALGRSYSPSFLQKNTNNTKICRIFEHTKPDYIDILNPKVVRAFIDSTYERYLSELGEDFGGASMPGFFTDEPQYALCATPWSIILNEEFLKQYGYELLPELPKLFVEIDGCKAVRFDFWSLINRLFTESYAKQIYDWCEEHNCRFTGHAMMEDNLYCQMHCTAGPMPMYEYMHIPGMDWLGRCVQSPLVPKQVSSVAAQTGKKQCISETYAMCGWDVSFEELRWISDWQYVNGINLICQHLFPYSIRGSRKQDFPPAMFYQSLWYDKYEKLNKRTSRLGYLLAKGREKVSTLILQPIHSCYPLFTSLEMNTCIDAQNKGIFAAIASVAAVHLPFHLGDETVMKRHGRVDSAKKLLAVGQMSYSLVILPDGTIGLDRSTFELLRDFAACGGKIAAFGSLPYLIDGRPGGEELTALCEKIDRVIPGSENSEEDRIRYLIENGEERISVTGQNGEEGNIHFTSRDLGDGKTLYFLFNQSKEVGFDVLVTLPGEKDAILVDLASGSTRATEYSSDSDASGIRFSLNFAPTQSHIILCGTGAESDSSDADEGTLIIRPGRSLEVAEVPDGKPFENVFLLDYAEYTCDGVDFSEPMHIVRCSMGLGGQSLTEKAAVRHRFTVKKGTSASALSGIRLVAEYNTPGTVITVNGVRIFPIEGQWWLDHAFPVYDTGNLIREGENEILISGDCVVRKEGEVFRSVGSLAPVFLLGDFGVFSASGYFDAEHRSTVTKGPFFLTDRPEKLDGGNIVPQGYPFFGGTIGLRQHVRVVPGTEKLRRVVDPGHVYSAVCGIYVNGKCVSDTLIDFRTADITDFVAVGENIVEYRLSIGDRNFLGPHHFHEPEPLGVGPEDLAPYSMRLWRHRYSFVKTGLGE